MNYFKSDAETTSSEILNDSFWLMIGSFQVALSKNATGRIPNFISTASLGVRTERVCLCLVLRIDVVNLGRVVPGVFLIEVVSLLI